jgi:hypothetical protein
MAPLAKLMLGKATMRDGSKKVCSPKPSHAGQAPKGELKENKRGSSSPMA